MAHFSKIVMRSLLLAGALAAIVQAQGGGEKPWEKRKGEASDRIGGVPEEILKLQSLKKGEMRRLRVVLRRPQGR